MGRDLPTGFDEGEVLVVLDALLRYLYLDRTQQCHVDHLTE